MQAHINTLVLICLVSLVSVGFAQGAATEKSAPAGEAAVPSFPYIAEITGDNVNIRSGPGTNYYICGQLSKTDKVNSSENELVPIDIKLPRPMFVGTPQNIRVPNLEKPLGKPRPPFLAPAGTKNVAFEKPVSCTDEEPIIGEIEMITDGDKEASDGSYVELGPFLQHVTVDLGAKHNIYAILIWHYHKQARVYFDVVIQVADDPDFITNVRTLFNNDHDNSSGLGIGEDMHYIETYEGELIDCFSKGIKARYVRLFSNGNTTNDLNHYIEVEVYGKPAKSAQAMYSSP